MGWEAYQGLLRKVTAGNRTPGPVQFRIVVFKRHLFCTMLLLLFQNKGWWTYEFCYGKSVKQYHMEGTSTSDPVSCDFVKIG